MSSAFVFLSLAGADDGHDAKNGTPKAPIKFTGLKPGRYHVRADVAMNDELDGEADVDVVAGQEAKVTIRIGEKKE